MFYSQLKSDAICETGDRVAILLATLNGVRFLEEQLDSIQAQAHQNWFVIASDDGSSDSTLEVLERYQARWPNGRLIIRHGPRQGFCQNFLSLAADPSIEADYFAFCDQDDVWLPQKLAIAVKALQAREDGASPLAYGGRTIFVSENLDVIGYAPLPSAPPSFANALVQSIGSGNTMVFNRHTKRLLEKAGRVEHASHDWWVYQLVTGAAGAFIYDPIPQIFYRQHKGNRVGAGNTLTDYLKRIAVVLRGGYRLRTDQNLHALNTVHEYLTSQTHAELSMFSYARNASLPERLAMIKRAGLVAQERRGPLSLLIATILKKL